MTNIKPALAWLLRAFSLYLIFDGFVIFRNTSGYVQGSEFGMLITLASEISLVMVWLALFALWSSAPAADPIGK